MINQFLFWTRFVFLFFLIALLETTPFLPPFLTYILPDLFLLGLLFYAYRYPYKIGLLIAAVIGLFADVIYVSTMGFHTLLYVNFLYIFLIFFNRFKYYTFFQQALIIGLILMLNLIIKMIPVFWINHFLFSHFIELFYLSIIKGIIGFLFWIGLSFFYVNEQYTK